MILIKDLIKDYEKYSDKEVEVGGWIKNSRFSKNVGFIELNDGTFFNPVQIVVGKDNEDFEKSEKLKLSSAIIVVGKLVLTPNSKQPFEIQASKVIVEGESTDDYPLQKKRHTFEFLRTILHLRPRTNTFNAVFRVRSRLAFAIHKFFNERGFVYVHTPIITGSDAEGAGEMFRVTTLDLDNLPKDDNGNIDFSQDFFSKSTNLTVSGQLQAEAYALAFRNVYTFGPTFRSEHSNTPRHAAEFWMMEPEICFADLDDVCSLAEDMVRYIIKDVMENCEEEIKFFNSFVDKNLIERLTKVANKSFKKLTYTEAIDILQKSGEKFEYPVEWGMDLQTEHEKYLSEKVVDGPVFVTDYPKEIKAFYMRLNDDKKTVAATDLLVPGIGELIGGSQREERFELLDQKMDELGFNKEEYKWYLDLRKYGGVKHGGFGLGFERMVMYMTGMSNIRDVIPFPRTVGHCEY
ncbi:MAG: asparagine--tRNA ligase [Finegoldia magna]|uniref:Asparagine--tRNA ligase n=2 Tax=Finegoldia magna TaxID=1260 RepID=E1KWA1_FINMA|nr:asparagine--tRNA ligase [Finegoldia magna]EFL54617.1 asparagine--tRNA ligase [Finegoldia magna BVS033A4]MDU5185949.1 asparagine--tRNA ligase [Finegoldia magna]MDU5924241.1 asparagine--tRNA ligase [Finegoldia magna]MDU5969842.1 asparagine--tRNA ligase [Finegoldia magna]MDU6597964.1 asparagine--tRNA ligase [Finegoldia magna]